MSWDPVYRLVKKVPRGRVITYGQIARLLDLRGGARSAGYAMAASPNGKGIPWHRVVAAGGKLMVREPYASLQRRMLESEGTPIKGARVDIEACGWLPGKKSPARKRAKRRPPRPARA
jgi:methylated-DNA-protein-cysteine methyltransferase related protein